MAGSSTWHPRRAPLKTEVRRFYRRQGALVLLTYMLGATDFHFENVLAIGEHPVLIDLETLFHPYPNPPDAVQPSADASIQRCVLRSGLLPRWAGNGVGLAGVDISGLGTRPGQKTSVGMPTWEGEGTDRQRYARGIVELPGGQNRATLNGADLHVVDFLEDVVAGFSAAYRLVVALRDQLLDPNGPMARFAHDEVRVILRSTQRYAILRYEASHPNLLRDALDRDRSFDRLWNEVAQTPFLAKLILGARGSVARRHPDVLHDAERDHPAGQPGPPDRRRDRRAQPPAGRAAAPQVRRARSRAADLVSARLALDAGGGHAQDTAPRPPPARRYGGPDRAIALAPGGAQDR